MRTLNGIILQQGAGDGTHGGVRGAVRAGGYRGAHDSVALAAHDGFHVGKVAVDNAGHGDDVRDALYGLAKNVVGDAEGVCLLYTSSLLMYLTERKLFFSVNHVFSGLTGRREEEDFNWFASYVPAFETRNGQMWQQANASAARLADRLGKIAIAGSDSHTMAGVGRTFTEVRGAQTIDEFFAGLRAGRGMVHGRHGSFPRLTADIYRIAKCVFDENPAMLPILPLTVLIPLFTVSHWLNEVRFCRKWSARLESGEARPRMLWEVDAGLEVTWAS